jgi:hypothetical protein
MKRSNKTHITVGRNKIPLEIPKPSNHQSFFSFALHKSGSVLLNQILTEVCKKTDIPAIDIPQLIFNNGQLFKNLDKNFDSLLREKGYAYLGFRSFLPYESSFNFKNVKSIYLIRDPRDMLVSMYFSIKSSHSLPGKGVGRTSLLNQRNIAKETLIDDFVLTRSNFYLQNFSILDKKLPKDSTKIYRYEDFIFNKDKWIIDILNFLSLKMEVNDINSIVEKVNIIPKTEQQDNHIRKVTPGDHKIKLRTDTINKLNNIFKPILIKYGYSL